EILYPYIFFTTALGTLESFNKSRIICVLDDERTPD
ncbi:MAG: hypothetical protein ACI9FG_000827, partial [Crocinitomicaceae bacterium]